MTNIDVTTMTAPLSANVEALIWSQNSALSVEQVKQRLFDSADPIDHLACNASYVVKLGAGRINDYESVKDGFPLIDKLANDFNNDSKSDLLWRNSPTGQVAVWLMNGASFSATGITGTVSDLVGRFNNLQTPAKPKACFVNRSNL